MIWFQKVFAFFVITWPTDAYLIQNNVTLDWKLAKVAHITITRQFLWGSEDKKDIDVVLELSFEDAYYGKEIGMSFERLVENSYAPSVSSLIVFTLVCSCIPNPGCTPFLCCI